MKPRIAVLIAVHNRWEMTNILLDFLCSSQDYFHINVHIVDDGSTDETEESLRKHPTVSYVRGDGNLFWAKSMKIAQDSVINPFDYLLWLNNDVKPFHDFFEKLWKSINEFPNSILVGQTIDAETEEITYGGLKRLGRHPHRMKKIRAIDKFESADTFCGNIVLIPKGYNDLLGGIDGIYEHGYADYDYGLRATEKKIDIKVVPGFLGSCSNNASPFLGKSRWQILRIALSRKYLPIRSQIRYTRRHAGVEWPIYVLTPYIRSVLKIKSFNSKKISEGF